MATKLTYTNQRLPEVHIVGAAKSGTTSLYQMLLLHPKIFFPESKKEPMFFCFGGQEPPVNLDPKMKAQAVIEPDAYFNLYTSAGEDQLAFDGTTAYLYRYEETIEHMRRFYGDQLAEVKIIILLRNPVDRAWSHYNYLIRNGFETMPFREAIVPKVIARRKDERWGFDYLGFGMYHKQVKAFIECFPQTRVYLTEDLKSHQVLLDNVFDFLGIESIEVSNAKEVNPSGVPKSRFLVDQMRKNSFLKKAVNILPERMKHEVLQQRDKLMSNLLVKKKLEESTRTLLQNYYEDDIKALSKLIDRDLSRWLIKN